MLFHWYTGETDDQIRWFLCSMWLPTVIRFYYKCKNSLQWHKKNVYRPEKGNPLIASPWSLHPTHIPPILQRLQDETGNSLSKERLARIFNKPLLVAYRWPISLRDILVSTKFKTVGNTPLPRGCEACRKPKCSWCKEINKTTTCSSSNNNKIFKIFHSVNCQSSWVIYIIECNICNLQYIIQSSLKQPQKSYQKGNQQLWTYGSFPTK